MLRGTVPALTHARRHGRLRIQPSPSLFSTAAPPNPLSRIRTVGISAHIDAGKTTTTERMLLAAKAISRAGTVDGGDTVTDFLPAERARGITIKAAAVTFAWRGASINLIDTPGHVDFTVEVERSLRVLDGVVALFDAVAGVEAQSETVWAQAARYGVARIAFANKMDREGASLDGVAASVRARLGATPLVLHAPVGAAGEFAGVVDLTTLRVVGAESPASAGAAGAPWSACLRNAVAAARAGGPRTMLVPARADGGGPLSVDVLKLEEMARAGRESMLVALADADDAVAEAYVTSSDASWDLTTPGLDATGLRAAVRRVVCAQGCRILPLLAGASARGKGVDALLDAVVDFLPSPLEKPLLFAEPFFVARSAGRKSGTRTGRAATASAALNVAPAPGAPSGTASEAVQDARVAIPAVSTGPLRALAFKVQHHPVRGALVFFRVYAGTLTRALALHNTSTNTRERPSKLLQLFADELREVDAVGAGHIGAASGLKTVRTGDTLCHDGDPTPVVLARLALPTPVFSVALETAGATEARALDDALDILLREDPSLTASTHDETGQLLLSGMGELHLEIAVGRLRDELGVPGLTVGRVVVAMREAPTVASTGAATFEKIIAGKRVAATVALNLEPCPDLLEADTSEFDDEDGAPLMCATDTGKGSGGGDDDAAVRAMPLPLADAVRDGVIAGLGRGALLGFPISGARVAVNPVGTRFGADSSPAAVRAATARALVAAMRGAACELREPLMSVRVTLPDAAVGDVLNDLTSARRARIVEVVPAEGAMGRATIIADVPLRALLGYATALRSRTSGEASLIMEMGGWEGVGPAEQRKIIVSMGAKGFD